MDKFIAHVNATSNESQGNDLDLVSAVNLWEYL